MKKLHALVALLLCVVCLPLNALAGQTPYYTETEDHNGRLVYSQTGYIPDGTFAEFNDKQLPPTFSSTRTTTCISPMKATTASSCVRWMAN